MTGRSEPAESKAAALADRLAREIKQRRLEAGMSQRVLAGRIGYSRQYVSMAEWEDGNLPSRELVAAIDFAVGADDLLNTLRKRATAAQRVVRTAAGPRYARSSSALESGEVQNVRTVPSSYGQRHSELLDVLGRIQKLSRTVDPEVVHSMAAYVRVAIESYETSDSTELIPGLVRQRKWIETLLDDCGSPCPRQRLYEVAAQTSGLLGYIHVGLGEFELSRAYSHEAFQLSSLAESADVQAWVRGTQSFCEYYAGRYHEALRFAQAGLSLGVSGPQRVRLEVNGVAGALGKLGDVSGVERAVDEAYKVMDRNSAAGGNASSISLEKYSSAQVAGNAATAYLSLRMPDRVEVHVRKALDEMDASEYPWGRSLVKIDFARSIVLSPKADLEHAISLLSDALGTHAGGPTVPMRTRAAEFAQDIAAIWGDSPHLRTVRAVISNSGGASGRS